MLGDCCYPDPDNNDSDKDDLDDEDVVPELSPQKQAGPREVLIYRRKKMRKV